MTQRFRAVKPQRKFQDVSSAAEGDETENCTGPLEGTAFSVVE
jgi:hypothetical protein